MIAKAGHCQQRNTATMSATYVKRKNRCLLFLFCISTFSPPSSLSSSKPSLAPELIYLPQTCTSSLKLPTSHNLISKHPGCRVTGTASCKPGYLALIRLESWKEANQTEPSSASDLDLSRVHFLTLSSTTSQLLSKAQNSHHITHLHGAINKSRRPKRSRRTTHRYLSLGILLSQWLLLPQFWVVLLGPLGLRRHRHRLHRRRPRLARLRQLPPQAQARPRPALRHGLDGAREQVRSRQQQLRPSPAAVHASVQHGQLPASGTAAAAAVHGSDVQQQRGVLRPAGWTAGGCRAAATGLLRTAAEGCGRGERV